MQVTTVTFMLPLSVGLAAAVRTGNLLGAGDFVAARYSSFFAIIVAVSLASFNFIALILLKVGGFFLVNKGYGDSSNFVVQEIKKTFSFEKVGHLGTLDPAAEGLLIIAINRATKFSNYFP